MPTNQPPVINSVTVTPQSAPAGTIRHIVVSVSGKLPLTVDMKVNGVEQNPTVSFDVVV